jgi:hypothetical protein
VLDRGTEISSALGAAVAVQRAVVERGSFFVCDKSHKRQRSALLRGARPPGRGRYKLTSPCRTRFLLLIFFVGGPVWAHPLKGTFFVTAK